MFIPSTYTVSPDRYSDQQIKQESGLEQQEGQKFSGFSETFRFVDIIDDTAPVRMRVIPNGKTLWQNSSKTIIYQTDGIIGAESEFNLKRLTTEYCNKPISPLINAYDGTFSRAGTYDETIVRQPNNIWHFDAFEGPKKIVFPKLNYSHIDVFNNWYSFWWRWWFGTGVDGEYYSPYPTGWIIESTNVDFRHTIYNSYISPSVYLFCERTKLSGLSPTLMRDTGGTFPLNPQINQFMPSGSSLVFPNPSNQYQYADETVPYFPESQRGFYIVGATFDGSSILLRPHCFSSIGVHYALDYSVNWEPVETHATISFYNIVTVPTDYVNWPWQKPRVESNKPRWGSYDIADGSISSGLPWSVEFVHPYVGWEYSYRHMVDGFPYFSGYSVATEKPIVELEPNNYCKYIYRDVIVAYRNADILGPNEWFPPSRIGPYPGKEIHHYGNAISVDVEITFKKKPFPDIASIPNIKNVNKFLVEAQNPRALSYREISQKTTNNTIPEIGFMAYKAFTNIDEVRAAVPGFERDYLGYMPSPGGPPNEYGTYFGRSFCEYALATGNIYADAPFLFAYYDPDYEYLIQSSAYSPPSIPPLVMTNGIASTIFQYGGVTYGFGCYLDFNPYGYSSVVLGASLGPIASSFFYTDVPSNDHYSLIPQYTMSVITNSGTTQKLRNIERMRDRFGVRGFGDGWFMIETEGPPGEYTPNFYDPDGNLLYYGDLRNIGDPISPTSNGDFQPVFDGNYIVDDAYWGTNSAGERVIIGKIWFFSSELRFSAYNSGVFSGQPPQRSFKPFGSSFLGETNNTKYCKDGIYLATQTVSQYRANYNSGFYETNGEFDSEIEIIIGAFRVDTSNNQFSVSLVALNEVPGLDLTKPYKGCVNASFYKSISSYRSDTSSNNYSAEYYYPRLEGKPEIYVKSGLIPNIGPLVKIYGPDDTLLVYNTDYSVESVPEINRPGNFRIKFLQRIGDCYENIPTQNPPRLRDGKYKFYFPQPVSSNSVSCYSAIENYTSLFMLNWRWDYYNAYLSEFALFNNTPIDPNSWPWRNYAGQFYNPNTYGNYLTLATIDVVSLSPISFWIRNAIFHGSVNQQWQGFKCDLLFTEQPDQNELFVNPVGYNNILRGDLQADGGFNY